MCVSVCLQSQEAASGYIPAADDVGRAPGRARVLSAASCSTAAIAAVTYLFYCIMLQESVLYIIIFSVGDNCELIDFWFSYLLTTLLSHTLLTVDIQTFVQIS